MLAGIGLAILSAGALYAFYFYVPELFGGLDGIGIKHHVTERLRWLTPFQVNAINPYQGVGNIWFSTSVWLNPGYAIFATVSDLRFALPASYAVFAAIGAAATCFFARSLAPDLDRIAAWTLGLIGGLVVLPPFARMIGVSPIFEFAPGGAYYAAIYLVLMGLLLRLGTAPLPRLAVLAVAFGLLALYGIVCDPMWMPMLFLSVAPFGLAALICDLSWRPLLVRTAVCAVVATLFYAFGTLDYLAGLAGYTSRLFFWQESQGLPRAASILFFGLADPRGFWLAIVFALGFVLAVIAGPRRVRVMAVASLLILFAHFAYSLAYLVVRKPWPYPLPLYLEIMPRAIFCVVAGIGWMRAIDRVLRAGMPAAAAQWLAGPRWRAVAWLSLPAALFALAAWSIVTYRANQRPELAAIGSRTSRVEVVQMMIDQTALDPGATFRGVTAGTRQTGTEYFEYKKLLGEAIYYPDVWQHRVPTFHEYSQLVTPTMWYLVSRLAGQGPFDSRNHPPYPNPTPKGIDMLEALGVRLLVSDYPVNNDGVLLKHSRYGGRLPRLHAYLYELRNPNLGQYSPIRVITRVRARDILAELAKPEFDFQRDVVLEHAPEASLVPARSGRLIFERGWVRVIADSPGTSLLLLPIQYSHCLSFDGAPDVRLVRANLVQAALLFSGSIDVRFNYRFSPLSQPRCRKADLEDMRRAELQNEVRPIQSDWTTWAPWSAQPVSAVVKTLLSLRLRGY